MKYAELGGKTKANAIWVASADYLRWNGLNLNRTA